MKIECTVDELKELLNYRIPNIKIDLDGEKVGKQIQPSIERNINSLE